MTVPRILPATLALALLAGALPVRAHEDEYGTRWLEERREERSEARREERNARTKRDPLVPLTRQGLDRGRPTPQNPLAPRARPKRPWNIGR